MASAPQPSLPLFFNDLMPLNSNDHKSWKSIKFDDVKFLGSTHAVPLTIDEFIDAQRSFPIIFSTGDDPVPLAMMGLNEGVNTFVDDDGQLLENAYLPAYVRRYPFILARLRQDSDELSLCFDPTAGVVGDHKEGNDLFTEAGEPSEYTQAVLDFCQKFEEAGARTKAFMEQIKDLDILMDGEIAITQNDNPDKPFIYRGFRMVDEKKYRELPAEKLEELHKNGIMALIHAHLFSLNLMQVVFYRQVRQGKGPEGASAVLQN